MDAVSFIKERLALADAGDWQADKFIWSIAFARNAKLTVPSVNLGNLCLQVLCGLKNIGICVICVICGKSNVTLCLKKTYRLFALVAKK